MKGLQTLSLAALSSTALASLTPITIKGNAFWQGSKRFYIRGVDYQPGGASDPEDPLANPAICKRDIPYFKQLGVNTIRVYTIDNSAKHDECMAALDAAGIYLALDVNSAKYSLNREDPAPSYNDVYLQSVFATIDEFQQYDNTLLFFSGNEVLNKPSNTNAAPYIKAVTRDMKTYLQARGYRQIPVGYSAADVVEIRYQSAAYMNCGEDGYARSDFFSFNDYSWCGSDSSYQISGWATNVQTYNNYSIPLFLSEYGCIDPQPRTFDEVTALYNPKEMTPVYSGGMAYQYTEESDNPGYGLVKVSGSSVKELRDFNTFKEKLSQYPSPAGTGGYHSGLKPLACPSFSKDWKVKGEGLPAMPAPALKFMKSGAGPGPGLKGKGSQNTGTDSTGMVTASNAGIKESNTAAGTPLGTSAAGGGSTGSTGAAGSLRPAEWPVAALIGGFTVVASTLLGATVL